MKHQQPTNQEQPIPKPLPAAPVSTAEIAPMRLPRLMPTTRTLLHRLVDDGSLVAHELEHGDWYASLALVKRTLAFEAWPSGVILPTPYGLVVDRRLRRGLTPPEDSAQSSPSTPGVPS